ncbi:hypothetical protein BDZ91DRAFT_833398, partial [Kalaharituber pfeilii]
MALIDAGALVKTAGANSLVVLDLVKVVGREPSLSSIWSEDQSTGQNEEAVRVYEWRRRCEKIIFLLLDKLDPSHGRTPLHVAAEVGNLQRVKELAERQGARVSVCDRDGKTPLML